MSAKRYSIGSTVWPGLSKIIEEAGEVQQVAGKLIGNGGADDHWDGTKLRPRLEDEIADLTAACIFFTATNHLDRDRMDLRISRKLALFNEWHSKELAKGDAP